MRGHLRVVPLVVNWSLVIPAGTVDPPRPGADAAAVPSRPRYSRWRAATLAGVYVLMGLHIAHWKIAGRTLAPLELNEVMYTLELGIVTAGFLFMAVVCIATLVFGRFFCSWGCHILALEDLCAWILGKLGVRPKPVRSRVLLLVPPIAMLYMFAWPQFSRWLDAKPSLGLHLASDTDGWASFVTTDFWRNLPGPWVAAVTFLVCGFVSVYVLGSRAFCIYACPYGAVFKVLDRFAPGRIVSAGDCSDCGACTAACQSHVRVKEELVLHGMVVNPACLKDLDCVAACPSGKVRFGFQRPPGLRSFTDLRALRPRFDYSLREDLVMATVFIVVLTIARGLYDTVPFLLALALAGVGAFLSVFLVRAAAARDLRWNSLRIKDAGKWTAIGSVFVALAGLAAAATIHSSWIRAHEFLGARAMGALERSLATGAGPDPAAVETARAHLETCRRFGLMVPSRLEASIARLDEIRGDSAAAERGFRRVLGRHPDHLHARLALARVVARAGRPQEAAEVLRAGLEAGPANPRERAMFEEFAATAHLGLGEQMADEGKLEEAAQHLQSSISLRPRCREARYALGVVLTALGRGEEAISQYEGAIAIEPDDPDLLNNLAWLYMERESLDQAEPKLRRALELAPGHAASHYNLARLLSRRGEAREAEAHMEAAARFDPRFAGMPPTQ